MSPPNGHANGSGGSQLDTKESVSPAALIGASTPSQFTSEQIQELVAALEVPFDSGVIEWRVTNTTKINGNPRGQVIPYADQRAYTDRLNRLFTPAGWTRRYTVNTSSNFQRSDDQKTVAKVFVTCDMTIFGLGSHSATGEAWTDDDNAVTSAEAQAFKRACSCLGLGRYLYYFSGVWVDLDDRKRLKAIPRLVGWATPEGWRQGLRPDRATGQHASKSDGEHGPSATSQNVTSGNVSRSERAALVRQIEAMAETLGRRLYRGLLKRAAHVWNPNEIQDALILRRVLTQMQSAERGLRRLDAGLDKTGSEALARILHALNLGSVDRIENLETLRQVVLAIETEATGSDQF